MLPIRVTAGFLADDQQDFEIIDKKADMEDIRNSRWEEIWINADHISSMWPVGEFTNLNLINEGYTIKESPKEIAGRISNRRKQKFRIGLN